MEEKFRIFEEEKFNKILDLLEIVDTDLLEQYKKIISAIPTKVVNAVAECEDFDVSTSSYTADMLRITDGAKDSIFLTFNNTKNNLKIELNIFPFSEFDINPELKALNDSYMKELNLEVKKEEDLPWFVFSLTLSQDDKIYDWEVYVQPYDDEFQIISIKNYKEQMVEQKVITLSYEELIQYADNEEYCEDDEYYEEDDIEFDGIAEYDEEGNLVTHLFKEEDFENVAIDEESGEPEIEVELHVELPPEEDDLDDEADYQP